MIAVGVIIGVVVFVIMKKRMSENENIKEEEER